MTWQLERLDGGPKDETKYGSPGFASVALTFATGEAHLSQYQDDGSYLVTRCRDGAVVARVVETSVSDAAAKFGYPKPGWDPVAAQDRIARRAREYGLVPRVRWHLWAAGIGLAGVAALAYLLL